LSGEGEFGWEIEGNEGGDGEGQLLNSRGTKESMYNRALIKLRLELGAGGGGYGHFE